MMHTSMIGGYDGKCHESINDHATTKHYAMSEGGLDAITAASACYYDGSIYLIGGWGPHKKVPCSYRASLISSVCHWSRLLPLPPSDRPRDRHATIGVPNMGVLALGIPIIMCHHICGHRLI